MKRQPTTTFIEKWRVKYKNLNPVYCPALKETINFNSEGFNHILYKNRVRRTVKEIEYRLPLINLICPVIKNSKNASLRVVTKIIKGREIKVNYYALTAEVGKKKPCTIKVILIKKGLKGKLSFHSVMKIK